MTEERMRIASEGDNVTVSTMLTIDMPEDVPPQIALPHHFSHPGHNSKDVGDSSRTHQSGFVNPAFEDEDDTDSGSYETGSTFTDDSVESVRRNLAHDTEDLQDEATKGDPHEELPVPNPAQYSDPLGSSDAKNTDKDTSSKGKDTQDNGSILSGKANHHQQSGAKHVHIVVPTTVLSDPDAHATRSSGRITITEDDNNHKLDVYRPIVPMPGAHPAVPPPSAYNSPPQRRKIDRKISKTHMHKVITDEPKNDVIIPMQGQDLYTEVSETAYECPDFDEMTTYKAPPPLPPNVELPDYSHTHLEKEDLSKKKKEDHPFGDDMPAWDEITIKDIRENTDLCCSCCLYCFRGKLGKGTNSNHHQFTVNCFRWLKMHGCVHSAS